MGCAEQLPKRVCPICRATIQRMVSGSNSESLGEAGKGGGASTTKVGIAVGRRSIVQRVKMEEFESSSKIEAVVQHVQAMEPAAKCIVFSQYTPMLDLLEWRFKQEKVRSLCECLLEMQFCMSRL